ncbi:MAG: hypothetical protein IJ124_05115 [Clostridia bacterium]|nr:hypothetical protein [Clostridia bacterium]MBQ8708115.1 hypothetical protein [Succinivibrionaceae bacterium]MBQ8708161.1 hypothetical protein [Succinivibrionaceae bacterium]
MTMQEMMNGLKWGGHCPNPKGVTVGLAAPVIDTKDGKKRILIKAWSADMSKDEIIAALSGYGKIDIMKEVTK